MPYWSLALTLHLWPLPDTFLFFTASCAWPGGVLDCGASAGLWDQGRVWTWGTR